MIQLDPQGNCIINCDCGYFEFATNVSIVLQYCPSCKKEFDIQEVFCADINHNEPEGCGNPKCWKYHEKQ